MVPGVERQPLKKLESDEDQLLKLMDRWRHEAIPAGREIERVVVAFEGGARRILAGALAARAGRRGL